MVRLLDNGLKIENGNARYAWFRVLGEQSEHFRAVALKELRYIPAREREDPDALGKQWLAVRGLYNAGVDTLYLAAGMFAPRHIGIVQYYGAAAEGKSKTEAAEEALYRLAAVEATLANFPQTRLGMCDLERLQWLVEFLLNAPHLLAVLGHPDPRQAAQGLGRDGRVGAVDEDLASQQNEMLFRGLALLREDFVFQVVTRCVSRPALSQTLVEVARFAAQYASRQKGQVSASVSLGIPLLTAISGAHAGGQSGAQTQAHSTADGASHGWGQGQSNTWSHTDSQSQTVGGAETWGEGQSHTDSWAHTDSHVVGVGQSVSTAQSDSHATGVAHTDSRAETNSTSHTDSQSVSDGVSASWGHTASSSVSDSSSHSAGGMSNWSAGAAASVAHSAGTSETESQGISDSASLGHTQSSSDSTSNSSSHTAGAAISLNGSLSGGLTVEPEIAASQLGNLHGSGTIGGSHTLSQSNSLGQSASHTQGAADSLSVSHAETASVTHGASQNVTAGQSASVGVGGGASWSDGASHSVSAGVSDSVGGAVSHSVSVGSADTVGHASTVGSADSRSESWGTSDSQGQATSRSEAWGTADTVGGADSVSQTHSISSSWASSKGTADSTGGANSQQESWGQSHADGVSQGTGVSRSGMESFAAGYSTGVTPGVALTRSWQTEDDVAIRLTELLRGLESLVNTAAAEGGFLTDARLLLRTPAGAKAAEALIPQAFHGPNVPTPVRTEPISDDQSIQFRNCARAFLPSHGDGQTDPLTDGKLWRGHSFLTTAGMVASYTAPGMFEEGLATTVQEALPPLGFYPAMRGDVALGHQFSPETGQLTHAPVRLEQARHFHTAFAGDTGYGKSVLAIRLAYETTLKWKLRTIALDFGAGWRALLNAPGLEGHVDIYQLWPGAVRPLRWNPLQIGRCITPEHQWRSFADVFGTIAQLGVKRQKQELLDALRQVYLYAGALVDDPDARRDPKWGKVQPNEAGLISHPAGTPLDALTLDERQQLAVERSKAVGLADLHAVVSAKLAKTNPRDVTRCSLLEGLLYRLNPLVQGSAAGQYAPGEGSFPIETLSSPWGLTILEGGAYLDEFSKAFLLGWAAWHLYTDAMVRRIRRASGPESYLQIFFEEANKILAGVSSGSGDDETGGPTTGEQFAAMWRDSRKYGIWLHVICQSPALLPPGILSSCNNLAAAELKNPKDRDLIIAALARSEKGLVDELWRRFLARIAVGQFVGRFGYSRDLADMEPMLFQPLLLNLPEPTDEEIVKRLRNGTLAS